jgi:5-methylthioadenosine/S-adenosylhomocysteine deaminase
MNILIHSGTILPLNGKPLIRDGAVAIEGNTIVAVGKTGDLKGKCGKGFEKIDAEGCIVMPGLINTHQHAAMSLLRGYADDLPLQEWLEKRIWPIEAKMTPHDIYAGALLTAAESIMSGTTTVNTMYHYFPEENEAKAFADAGLRGVIGHVCFSWRKKEDIEALERLARGWHRQKNGLIRVSVDPHSPYTVDPGYMKELEATRKELNQKYGSTADPIITHIHIAETREEKSKVQKTFKLQLKNGLMEYLDSLGVLHENVIAAHCVALEDMDFAVMKKRKVKISHNPISNLKLASGISPINTVIEKGITVSLGTDSPCSNNSADMFEVMKTTALLHKGVNNNPTLVPASKVLELATIDGAKALSWEKEIGSIDIGKKADLVIIDLKKPHFCPVHNEISHLVYAAKGSDAKTVIIDGKIVMENRELATVKTDHVMEMAEKAKNTLLEKLDANIK